MTQLQATAAAERQLAEEQREEAGAYRQVAESQISDLHQQLAQARAAAKAQRQLAEGQISELQETLDRQQGEFAEAPSKEGREKERLHARLNNMVRPRRSSVFEETPPCAHPEGKPILEVLTLRSAPQGIT